MGPNWVRTIVECARHRREATTLCVHVDRGVPDFLRCTPSGGGVGGGGGTGPDCPCGGRFPTGGELGRRVVEAMRSNMPEWKRRGAVVITI
jgi:hypothetical protein